MRRGNDIHVHAGWSVVGIHHLRDDVRPAGAGCACRGDDEAFDAANEEKEPGETAVVIAPETLVENEAMKPFLEKLSKKMTDPEGKGYSVNVDVIPPTGNN